MYHQATEPDILLPEKRTMPLARNLYDNFYYVYQSDCLNERPTERHWTDIRTNERIAFEWVLSGNLVDF